MTIIGTSGNDLLNGTSKADKFNLMQGGNDSAFGRNGKDTFILGKAFDAHDHINGGAGIDTLLLKGNYGKGIALGKATLTNVETIGLTGGFNYKLATHDNTVAAGKALTVDGHALGHGKSLVFNGAKETNGHFNIIGGAGNDVLTGGAQSDAFDLHRGGNDAVKAGGGNDVVNLFGGLTALDAIDGGSGVDRVNLAGDYSAGLVLAPVTLTSVEQIGLAAGHGYSLTTSEATIAAGANLLVDGSALGAGDTLHFNAAAESDGSVTLIGGAGADQLTGGGGGGGDSIDLHRGGNDIAEGGAGNDSFIFDGALTAADAIDGGAGTDVVKLRGDYAAPLTLGPTSVVNVEEIDLAGGFRYDIATDDATVAAGKTLIVDGSALGAGDFIFFRGGAETDGKFNAVGGAGNDTFVGGAGDDTFDGGNGSDLFFLQNGGADTAKGGAGNDTFTMRGALNQADRIDGGAGSNDVVNLEGCVVVFNATTITNVEWINLADNFSYDLTTVDATVAAGEMLTIDGNAMSAVTQTLIFHGDSELDGQFQVIDGAGNDIIFGGAQGDLFQMGEGGNDAVRAGDGDDGLLLFDKFTSADQVDGGAGQDHLSLNGDYAGANAVTFGALTMTNVETIDLGVGHSYTLVTNDSNVAAGQTLAVDGRYLGSGDQMVFNGGAESDGSFKLTGGGGDDDLGGGAEDDVFDLSQGGDDIAAGAFGSDTFILGAALKASDQIIGGSSPGDNDLVKLAGDYSGGLAFNATTMVQIETIELAALHSYSLVTDDATVAAGQTLKVDGSMLGAGDSLSFDGHLETLSSLHVMGGAGDDTLIGGAGNDSFSGGNGTDTFDLSFGGDDIAVGGTDWDTFWFGGAFTAADQVDGGSAGGDVDVVVLDGSYAAPIVFTATTMVNVETIQFVGGAYSLVVVDANVAAGEHLTVDGSNLTASGETLRFDGSAELDGSFQMIGGSDDDTLSGGAQDDGFNLTHGGNDTVKGGGGNDVINFGAAMTDQDSVDGGGGKSDTLYVAGNYSSGGPNPLGALSLAGVTNVERMVLGDGAGFDYKIGTADTTVAAGASLVVDASALGAQEKLSFDGTAETDGSFYILSGAGSDDLTGGTQGDMFGYFGIALSSATRDTINGFDFNEDVIKFANLTGIDAAITSGHLDDATFDGDLAALFGSSGSRPLGALHAVLFTADSGSENGHTFLIVDGNGQAGYDPGADLVVRLNGYSGTMDAGDFIA